MHCLACDCLLSDFEATRKYSCTNDYVDLCNRCFNGSEIPVTIREDLQTTEDIYEEFEDYNDEELEE